MWLSSIARNRRSLSLGLVLLGALMYPALVSAEPYLAQRYGQKCSGCHTNMTGGGKRSTTGEAYARALTESPIADGLSTQLNEAISVGANFRGEWAYTRFDDPEPAADGSVANEVDDANAFDISNGALYLEYALSDKISFYLDRQVAPEGGRTREALVLFKDLLGEDTYVKAGKFYLPFGLRLQDDEAFIRQMTGFTFDNSDMGAEVGFEPGPWSLSLAVTNGTQGSGENNTDKQVAFTGSFVQSNYRLGASASHNKGTGGFTQEAFNIFAGLNLGKWTFLGEVDRVKDSAAEEETIQIISFVSANYLWTPSINVKFSYEHLDPDDDIDENERIRVSLIGEKFFNQYTQLRIGVRRLEGIPQNPQQNQGLGFAEIHVFF